MKFLSPWKLWLIFKSSIWPFSPLHWWFPLESSPTVCFHCQKWLPFRFFGIIHFNFLQMKVDAFSQRQQFLYFRNSLLKLGQSGERHLDFYKRKKDQVNLIVNSLSFSLSQPQENNKKINDHIFCSGLLIFIVVQTGIPYLTWLTRKYSPLSALSSKLLRIVCDELFPVRIFTK